eukprot:CAMPEP_0119108014 /NCGR_PEP_ID=MMETSP1180-20130426/13016_1 /TAXON_ID=3052 ORGANISM="Chlamydomonas cf sp, Strain CCMP681" /NCGR_SAMPLE_ID=MMETSP1180 /ASSEMBLY_ACC=CAM_ASM_000741 /LENGTH=265 /DNA_ID=CAMNT_0007093577 /DNA_START=17 /DNA_END=814 /DNA_ORIENTATION=-
MSALRFLAGKSALVTGSTSGIGLVVLKALAGAGCNVAMHGFGDQQQLKKIQDNIAAEHDVKVVFSDADLRNPLAIQDLVARVAGEFGSMDILHNNAGIQFVGPVETYPEEKWDAILDVCLSATFHCSKAVLPHMRHAGWGRIINTGSMHSLVASPYKAAYNAAKHGVAGFTKTLALELAQTQITVNCICPGYVLTDLVRNQIEDTARARNMAPERVMTEVMLADQPTKRFVAPEDIAGLVLHLCGPHSSSITGACLSIDGGWTSR